MKSVIPMSIVALSALIGACSGQGPDIVDPDGRVRSQVSMLAVAIENGSDLAIIKEPTGIASTTAYSAANGAPLPQRIDGIFQSFDLLYLLHCETGTITVVDVATRTKRAELNGFAGGPSALCGMAFSNLAQGWVIDYNASNIYHIDAVRPAVVDTFELVGRPTSVATIDDKVFVATQLSNGSGQISIFQSNFSTFRIDETLSFPTPVVFMSANGSNDAVIAVTAGAPGGKPGVHVLKLQPVRIVKERELNARDLTAHIGRVPEFAMMTLDNFLFIATADEVLRIDVKSPTLPAPTWLRGTYSVIGVDYWTGLLYAHDPAAMQIARVSESGDEEEDLDPIPVSVQVSAIEFVNSTKVR